jgi:hypothetical protein
LKRKVSGKNTIKIIGTHWGYFLTAKYIRFLDY